jgi:hypothetical protein
VSGAPPYVDRHGTDVPAPVPQVWTALRSYADSSLVAPPLLGRLLGADPLGGFAVTDEVPGERLDLAGRHRFSRYLLRFELTATAGGTRLEALTFADFPGVRGRAYRSLVIGSGLHVVAVDAMLRSVRRASTR